MEPGDFREIIGWWTRAVVAITAGKILTRKMLKKGSSAR
jgi:hypothetical protein